MEGSIRFLEVILISLKVIKVIVKKNVIFCPVL
jgi:hypothetical protein